ncbi:MAG: YkgJ family cysteine cluster protein [Bacteroidota bacterium]
MTDLIQDWRNRKTSIAPSHKKFLRKLRRKKGKKLNEQADELHESVFSELDCLDCANCCSTVPPMLNRADISRIARHLGMKPAKFEQEYLVEDEDGDMVMNTTPCPFLLDDNACLIYEYRPRACREYPHTDGLEFSQHFRLHAENTMHCPAVFHIIERMMKQVGE